MKRRPSPVRAPVRGVGVLVLGLAVASGACRDQGPTGPGAWSGVVRSSTAPSGAVILEVGGQGIRAIEGVEPTRAFGRRTAGPGAEGSGTETWHVVLVTPSPGSIRFQVEVDDLATGAPRAVVTSAVDGQDQPLASVASFSVDMSR